MYTSYTEPKVKESTLQSFCCENGTLRVIIATIAFGMGLDCPNIWEVIHWGPSSDLESYIQETGRAGRDGYLSHATLMYGAGDRHYFSLEMMLYVENEKCRRELLFSDFNEPDNCKIPCKQCQCCDICRSNCSCDMCLERSCFIVDNFIGISL